MDRGKYQSLHTFMRSCFKDAPHEVQHTERVLWYALRILATEKHADADVVIAAAILHDIGRQEPLGPHAEVGSEKSRLFLLQNGSPPGKAEHVAQCILTHSYKSKKIPQSLEAEIVFDADKLDVTGAIGVARAAFACQLAETPLFSLNEEGYPRPGTKEEEPSLLREYHKKLKNLPARLYTKKGRKLARKNQRVMDDFFEGLWREAKENYSKGLSLIRHYD